MSRAREILGAGVHRLHETRRRSRDLAERAAVAISPVLHRRADELSAYPFRSESLERPAGTALDDLVAYTRLPPDVVDELVCSRHPVDFRGEWLATPETLQRDHWFYLSSKTYLFANAPHFASEDEIVAVASLLPAGATVLEFGAGIGNLSIALADRGHHVVADELSALQRDFLRFRVARHGLGERVTVLDPWEAPRPGAADAVTAFDVLEHLPEGRATLDDRLIPALRPGGALIENSPFVQNVANPMHHADWGLDDHLRRRGLALEHEGTDGTRVWRSTPS